MMRRWRWGVFGVVALGMGGMGVWAGARLKDGSEPGGVALVAQDPKPEAGPKPPTFAGPPGAGEAGKAGSGEPVPPGTLPAPERPQTVDHLPPPPPGDLPGKPPELGKGAEVNVPVPPAFPAAAAAEPTPVAPPAPVTGPPAPPPGPPAPQSPLPLPDAATAPTPPSSVIPPTPPPAPPPPAGVMPQPPQPAPLPMNPEPTTGSWIRPQPAPTAPPPAPPAPAPTGDSLKALPPAPAPTPVDPAKPNNIFQALATSPATPPVVHPANSPWTLQVKIVDGHTQLEAQNGDKVQLRITCQQVQVQAPNGNIQAQGDVKLSGSDLNGSCDLLTIVWQQENVILEGKVHLKCPKDGQEIELTADRLSVKLAPGAAAKDKGRPTGAE